MDKQPKKKNSVSKYPFKLVEKNDNTKSLEGKFRKKIQTAISGTEHTVTTESGKFVRRKHNLGSIVFQTEKKKERAPQIRHKITPKNLHCLRGVDGKYIQWSQKVKKAKSTKKVTSKWKIRIHPKETVSNQSTQSPKTS